MSASSLRDLGSELLAALARVLDRIVGGLSNACAMLGIAIPAGAAGCHDSPKAPPPAAQVAPVEAPVAPVPDDEGKELGTFRVTFYYVIGEAEAEWIQKRHEAKHAAEAAGKDDAGSDAVMAAVDPAAKPEKVTLYDGRGCSPIAEVTPGFADQLALQGTGKLRDGRV